MPEEEQLNAEYDPLPFLTKEQKDEKSFLFSQLKHSINISLWSSFLTINFMLLTAMIFIISMNKEQINCYVFIFFIIFLFFMSTSCYFILKLNSKQRNILYNLERIYKPLKGFLTKSEYQKMTNEIANEISSFPKFEKFTSIPLVVNFVIVVFTFFIIVLK